ncbi:anti-sigma factor RsiW [Nakamurella sp. UYEF19]|uniref:zf-HC2 domain-containing protein n=1 Tax=Nakamurella sp. UYEF19 TaxID=1756392 RepID=UPI0033911DE4
MSSFFDDHLALDAIVAYADGEMSLTAYQRAAAHVMRCGACAADVAEQTAASQYLRQARMPTMPGSLFESLRSIPVAVPAARPVPGVVLDTVSGRARRSPEDSGQHRGRRFRMGAGALVAGIAVGAVVAASGADQSSLNPSAPIGQDTAAVSRPSPTSAPHSTVINVVARSSRATR